MRIKSICIKYFLLACMSSSFVGSFFGGGLPTSSSRSNTRKNKNRLIDLVMALDHEELDCLITSYEEEKRNEILSQPCDDNLNTLLHIVIPLCLNLKKRKLKNILSLSSIDKGLSTLLVLLRLPEKLKKICTNLERASFLEKWGKRFETTIDLFLLMPIAVGMESILPNLGKITVGSVQAVLEDVKSGIKNKFIAFKDANTIMHPFYYRMSHSLSKVNRDAYINLQNNAGKRPLYIAAELIATNLTTKNQQIVELIVWFLLLAGADPTIRDKEGRLPIYWAQKKNNFMMKAILEPFIELKHIPNIKKYFDRSYLNPIHSWDYKRSLLISGKEEDGIGFVVEALRNTLVSLLHNCIVFDANRIDNPQDWQYLKDLVQTSEIDLAREPHENNKLILIIKNISQKRMNNQVILDLLRPTYSSPIKLVIGTTNNYINLGCSTKLFGEHYIYKKDPEIMKNFLDYFINKYVSRCDEILENVLAQAVDLNNCSVH